ncbi:hypothetical protein FHG87_002860 [Trinorchestia longiramus]|nr:hypothetical protein FHG87_002860 [Trinorchestia longiramus]
MSDSSDSPTSEAAPPLVSKLPDPEPVSPTVKHEDITTMPSSMTFPDTNPSGADTGVPSDNMKPDFIINTPDSVSNTSSASTDADFVGSTRTELPFYDSDLPAASANGTTEAPTFYTDDSSDANDTYNPFLANDYDYYYYNPDVEREPYDYTQVDEDAKREEALALWKNVDIPPAVNYADFTPRDLDPYFLVLPPILCLAFLLMVFVPCFILKLRDDVRELSGKERKWGSKRQRKQISHESFQVIDPEWQISGSKHGSGHGLRDVQYVKPGASNTYDKSSTSAFNHAKENPAYVEENEICTQQPLKSSSKPDPPVDYSEEEVTSARENEQEESEETQSDQNVGNKRVGSPDTDEHESNQDADEKFTNSSKTTCPKFTGWNKDLYSNGAGFGPPANIANGKPVEGSEDPTWGMY